MVLKVEMDFWHVYAIFHLYLTSVKCCPYKQTRFLLVFGCIRIFLAF